MPTACDGLRRCGRRGAGRRRAATGSIAAALALAALAAGLGGGCTSEPASPTGSGLSGNLQFDTLLAPFEADTVKTFGELQVFNPAVPFSHDQVLYLGHPGDESASILARYNFATPLDSLPPGLAITAANIKSVRLRLFQLALIPAYTLQKLYRVYTLAQPLDSTQYVEPAFPFAPPTTDQLIASQYSAAGADVEIDLKHPDLFVQWYQQGTPNGIMITDADSTYDVGGGVKAPLPIGFSGYGSKENRFPASTIAGDLGAGTVVGPIIKVEFFDPPNTIIRWQALVDVTSFSSLLPLPPAPAQGLVLRTHLRAYPFLSFALDRLPRDAFINRAVLVVTNDPDTLQSYGPTVNIVCGEIPNEVLPRSGRPDSTFSLDSLATRIRIATGQTGLDPKTLRRLEFDVTLSIQRLVNGVYLRPFSFLLFSDEAFTGIFHTSGLDPDYELRRLHFLGTDAADPADRPHLMITYTRKGAVGGKATGGKP